MSFAISQLDGFNSFTKPNISFTALTSGTQDTTNQTTYTFSSVPFGEESTDRILLAWIGGGISGTSTLNSVTIGGVATTLLSANGTNSSSNWAYAIVPTGTSGSIVATFSAGHLNCGMQAFSIRNAFSFAPYATANPAGGGASTRTATLDVPANGICLAGSICNASINNWTNATKQNDFGGSESIGYTTGYINSQATTASVGVQSGTSTFAIAALSWI